MENLEGIEDYSDLVYGCRTELRRIGETWKSDRTLNFCEKLTGKRDAHYLSKEHLELLLKKLQELPTVEKSLRIGARVKVFQEIGTIRDWDEDFKVWIVWLNGNLEMVETEELELIS